MSLYAFVYPDNHHDGSTLGITFNDYEKKVNFNNPAVLPSGRYQDFIRNNNYNKSVELVQKDPSLEDTTNGNARAVFLAIDRLYNDKEVKSYAMYIALKQLLREYGLAVPKELVEKFYTDCTDTLYLNEIRDNYYKWTVLSRGNPAPEFALPDISDRTYSLKDLNGKYIYIDVWATWCVPCLQEMPYFDSLAGK